MKNENDEKIKLLCRQHVLHHVVAVTQTMASGVSAGMVLNQIERENFLLAAGYGLVSVFFLGRMINHLDGASQTSQKIAELRKSQKTR